MQHKTHYDTVSKAIEALRQQGFTTDFNIEENVLACTEGKFAAGDFDIVDVYRYEGISDPGDEAAVYAVKSSGGVKGILVTGYGVSADISDAELLEKLSKA